VNTTRDRQTPNNQTVFDQTDFFEADDFTRLLGLTATQITLQVFFGNTLQPWGIQDGYPVPDTQVVSGKVYWHEIPGAPGIYGVRWRPNAVGYWRLVFTLPAHQQVVALGYDVVPLERTAPGLQTSFLKPSC
jgi:hypothetical protein